MFLDNRAKVQLLSNEAETTARSWRRGNGQPRRRGSEVDTRWAQLYLGTCPSVIWTGTNWNGWVDGTHWSGWVVGTHWNIWVDGTH